MSNKPINYFFILAQLTGHTTWRFVAQGATIEGCLKHIDTNTKGVTVIKIYIIDRVTGYTKLLRKEKYTYGQTLRAQTN